MYSVHRSDLIFSKNRELVTRLQNVHQKVGQLTETVPLALVFAALLSKITYHFIESSVTDIINSWSIFIESHLAHLL